MSHMPFVRSDPPPPPLNPLFHLHQLSRPIAVLVSQTKSLASKQQPISTLNPPHSYSRSRSASFFTEVASKRRVRFEDNMPSNGGRRDGSYVDDRDPFNRQTWEKPTNTDSDQAKFDSTRPSTLPNTGRALEYGTPNHHGYAPWKSPYSRTSMYKRALPDSATVGLDNAEKNERLKKHINLVYPGLPAGHRIKAQNPEKDDAETVAGSIFATVERPQVYNPWAAKRMPEHQIPNPKARAAKEAAKKAEENAKEAEEAAAAAKEKEKDVTKSNGRDKKSMQPTVESVKDDGSTKTLTEAAMNNHKRDKSPSAAEKVAGWSFDAMGKQGGKKASSDASATSSKGSKACSHASTHAEIREMYREGMTNFKALETVKEEVTKLRDEEKEARKKQQEEHRKEKEERKKEMDERKKEKDELKKEKEELKKEREEVKKQREDEKKQRHETTRKLEDAAKRFEEEREERRKEKAERRKEQEQQSELMNKLLAKLDDLGKKYDDLKEDRSSASGKDTTKDAAKDTVKDLIKEIEAKSTSDDGKKDKKADEQAPSSKTTSNNMDVKKNQPAGNTITGKAKKKKGKGSNKQWSSWNPWAGGNDENDEKEDEGKDDKDDKKETKSRSGFDLLEDEADKEKENESKGPIVGGDWNWGDDEKKGDKGSARRTSVGAFPEDIDGEPMSD